MENTQGFLTEALGCRGVLRGERPERNVRMTPPQARSQVLPNPNFSRGRFLSKILAIKLCLFLFIYFFSPRMNAPATPLAARRSPPPPESASCSICSAATARLRRRQHLFVAVIHPDLEPCEHLLLRPRADLCCGEKGEKKKERTAPKLSHWRGPRQKMTNCASALFFSLSLGPLIYFRLFLLGGVQSRGSRSQIKSQLSSIFFFSLSSVMGV